MPTPLLLLALLTTGFSSAWAASSTLVSDPNDAEVQQTFSAPPYSISSLTAALLFAGTSGGGTAPYRERCIVIPFQLPSLGAVNAPFLDAAFTFNYASKNTTVAGNLDLHGIGKRSGPAVLTDDYWTATATADPTDAILLEDNIITVNSTAHGLKTTTLTGNAALTAWLNAQYANGAGAGQYVFLRLGTDAPQSTGSARYIITSTEGAVSAGTAGLRPQISYTLNPGPQPPPAVSIIASDSFNDYTGGLLAGQGTAGFGWATGWTAGPAGSVTANSAGNTAYAVPDGGGLIGGGRSLTLTGTGAGIPVTRGLTVPRTGTFYAGFLLAINNNPNTGDIFALYLNNSPSDTASGVNVGLRGNPSAGAFFFLGKGTTSPASGTLASLSGSITSTRYLVLKIEKTGTGNYNKTTAWVNPGTDSETSKPNGDLQLLQDLGTPTLSQVLLRASGLDSGDTGTMDALTLSQNFAGLMTPSRPGPDSAAVVARIQVEAAANGSTNAALPSQTLAPGASLTAYSVARGPDGSFISNHPALWSLTNLSGGIQQRDLTVSADRKSAVFRTNGSGTAQILALGNAGTVLASGLITVTAPLSTNPLGRPFIWSRLAERDAILGRIERNGIAAAQHLLVKNRAESAVAAHTANRDNYLRALPLETSSGIPKFTKTTTSANDGTLVQRYNAGTDCAVMYHLTGDVKYARCAADLLHNAVQAYLNVTPFTDVGNGGWIYSDGLLGEASVSGMQLPVIYDYLYDYLQAPRTVHQLATTGGTDVPFDFADAQAVFRNFYELTRDRGQANNNWSANMAQTLVPCALALDNATERANALKDYLVEDNARQTSLKTDATKYPNPSDIWPESLEYSNAVNTIHSYLMVLLDRYDPGLNLFQLYPNVPRSLARPFQLVYPNGIQIHFGDFHYDDEPEPWFHYEIVYRHAEARHLPLLGPVYGPLINAGIARNSYRRSGNVRDNALPLLWFTEAVPEAASAASLPRTDTLSHAGVALQRNPSSINNPLNGLMCFVGGGAHVHSHANGMNMELYGQGTVLGAEGGRGDYGSDLHENYYRLFAAHNTVIVNGASRGEGGWVGVAINTVQVAAMEPEASAPAVSPDLSFTCTTFLDDKGTAAEATQQRTLAIVRTSPTTGYYVDIFRSDSTQPGEFHDYLYHNLGNSLDLTRPDTTALPLTSQPARFQTDIGDPYAQPGWRYYTNTMASAAYAQTVRGQFTANVNGTTTYMDLHMPGATGREYATADAPGIIIPPASGTLAAPVLAIRQTGEAWNRPFAVVFEPHRGSATSGTVKNVSKLEKAGVLTGLKVESTVAGRNLTQYILSNPGAADTYTDPVSGIAFRGRFAVITDRGNGSMEFYIGDGHDLSYGGKRVFSSPASATQASVIFSPSTAPVTTANSPVNVVATALDAWRLAHFGTTGNTGPAANSADPNQDGENNLMEFATGQSPHALSLVSTTVLRTPGNLEFTYPRSPAAVSDGLIFSVEWADQANAISWIASGPGTMIPGSDNGFTHLVNATIPSGAAGKRFIRLRVSLPQP